VTVARALKAVAIARILIGLGGLHFYVSNEGAHAFLFGPPSALLFHLGFVAAAAFTIFGGRVLAAAHASCFTALWMLRPELFDGGDTFGRIAAIVMVLAITNAYYSPFKTREHSERAVTFHNAAVTMLVIQMCAVYTSAGLFKVLDPLWRRGDALHQVALLDDYRFVDVAAVLRVPVIGLTLSYAVMFLELTFALALRTRFKLVSVSSLLVMHVGIAIAMGLVGFALHMAGGLAVCVEDGTIRRRSGTDSAAVRPYALRLRRRTDPQRVSRTRALTIRRRPLHTPA